MIQSINIKQNQFTLLLQNPYSWKVLIEKSWGLQKGNNIKYIEVDSLGHTTGRDLIGLIYFISNGDELLNEGYNTWAFCFNVSRCINKAVIGESLIIG